MRNFIFFIVLVSLLGTQAYAGENRDKRKRKAQERQAQHQKQQEELATVKASDLYAQDELYREIQEQERVLRQLRKKLCLLHENNLKKHGQLRLSQDQLDYIERYKEIYVEAK